MRSALLLMRGGLSGAGEVAVEARDIGSQAVVNNNYLQVCVRARTHAILHPRYVSSVAVDDIN